MKPIREIFSFLEGKGAQLDTDDALRDIVSTQEEIAKKALEGIEVPIALQQVSCDVIREILADQKSPKWWEALRYSNFIQHPKLKTYRDNDDFEETVQRALSSVSASAANMALSVATQTDAELEFWIAEIEEKLEFDDALDKLEQMAMNELGATFPVEKGETDLPENQHLMN